MCRCGNAQRYQGSEDPTRTLPDELQADQDQENVNGGVETFTRNAADQQHANPRREHGQRKQRRRGEQVLTGELAQRYIGRQLDPVDRRKQDRASANENVAGESLGWT